MRGSKEISRIGAILLLFGITVPVFSVAAGYIRLDSSGESGSSSYLPGLIGNLGTTSPAPSVTTPTTGSPVTEPAGNLLSYSTNLSKVMRADTVDGMIEDRLSVSLSERVSAYRRLIGDWTSYSGAPLMATDDYTSESIAVFAGEVFDLPYSCGRECVIRYLKVESEQDASYTTVSVEVDTERPSVKAYMGYLLIATENGTKIRLCDSLGTTLSENISGYSPYYARDFQNRPIFTDDSGGFFIFDRETGAMLAVSEKEIRTGLFYDYPAIPTYSCGYEVKTDTSGYQRYYQQSSQKFRLSKYLRAFNFSENLAVVDLQSGKSVRVINTSGSVQFKPNTWYSWHTALEGQEMSVGDRYLFPDTFGIESVGVTGYDHGWLRLRVQTYSQNVQTRGKIVRDTFRLVDKKGNFFDIPEGYSLEGYSDGVLLLEKNGKYGYYTLEHKWIAQPIYTYATPFIQGLAVVGFRDGTVGMIDTSGNIVMPFVFTTLSTPSSGVVVGYCEGIGYQIFYLGEKSASDTSSEGD